MKEQKENIPASLQQTTDVGASTILDLKTEKAMETSSCPEPSIEMPFVWERGVGEGAKGEGGGGGGWLPLQENSKILI